MAEKTVAEQITDLETKIDSHDTKIENIKTVKEQEEGGSGYRFRTQYTSTEVLEKKRNV